MSLREPVPVDHHRPRATRRDFWRACEEAFPWRTHRFCGQEEGVTNHAERWSGTLRSRLHRLVRRSDSCWLHRLVRRSDSCSKSVERHLEARHLFLTACHLETKLATPL